MVYNKKSANPMEMNSYQKLTDSALADKALSKETALEMLSSDDIDILSLVNAAFSVRKHFKGSTVTVHVINNGQNGYCPEDCHYCAQAKSSKADIEEYAIKSDEEFIKEAEAAYNKGAFRYCMVFAGRGPTKKRTEHLAQLIKKIKSKYPLEVCVSAGLLDKEKVQILKEAGLDRLNHNLNTSEKHYNQICTTHTYQDRLNTLKTARTAGLQLCSGVIVGMNESCEDIIDVALQLRNMKVESIPVNFLIPIEGNVLDKDPLLTPEFCLRVLCLFRFLNPKAEIRIAAGREWHLRSMEVLALFPANSLFLDGYLNARGEENVRTLQMIKDAGFQIESEIPIDQLLKNKNLKPALKTPPLNRSILIKDLKDLRPQIRPKAIK